MVQSRPPGVQSHLLVLCVLREDCGFNGSRPGYPVFPEPNRKRSASGSRRAQADS
jgi:hypothetical protein